MPETTGSSVGDGAAAALDILSEADDEPDPLYYGFDQQVDVPDALEATAESDRRSKRADRCYFSAVAGPEAHADVLMALLTQYRDVEDGFAGLALEERLEGLLGVEQTESVVEERLVIDVA